MSVFDISYKVSCKQRIVAEDKEKAKKMIKSMLEYGLWDENSVEFLRIEEVL